MGNDGTEDGKEEQGQKERIFQAGVSEGTSYAREFRSSHVAVEELGECVRAMKLKAQRRREGAASAEPWRPRKVVDVPLAAGRKEPGNLDDWVAELLRLGNCDPSSLSMDVRPEKTLVQERPASLQPVKMREQSVALQIESEEPSTQGGVKTYEEEVSPLLRQKKSQEWNARRNTVRSDISNLPIENHPRLDKFLETQNEPSPRIKSAYRRTTKLILCQVVFVMLVLVLLAVSLIMGWFGEFMMLVKRKGGYLGIGVTSTLCFAVSGFLCHVLSTESRDTVRDWEREESPIEQRTVSIFKYTRRALGGAKKFYKWIKGSVRKYHVLSFFALVLLTIAGFFLTVVLYDRYIMFLQPIKDADTLYDVSVVGLLPIPSLAVGAPEFYTKSPIVEATTEKPSWYVRFFKALSKIRLREDQLGFYPDGQHM